MWQLQIYKKGVIFYEFLYSSVISCHGLAEIMLKFVIVNN